MARRYTPEQRAALNSISDALTDLREGAAAPRAEEEIRRGVREVEVLIGAAIRLGLAEHTIVPMAAFDWLRAGIPRRHRDTPRKRERMPTRLP
jgi:hypothetical protein